MLNIHVRSIFRLFLPINAPSNVTILPFSQPSQFGFHLQSTDPSQSCEYNIRLFNVDDLRAVQPECFSFAKRKLHYCQPSTTRASLIEGVFIRIKINHGFFDFRKSGTGGRINVRVDVTCSNSAGELVQSGSSPIFLLYPKRRKARDGDDEDSACLIISWLDTVTINNVNVNNDNAFSSPEQSSGEIHESPIYSFPNLPHEYDNPYILPVEEVNNSIESHEQYSENESNVLTDAGQAMQLYNNLVSQTSSDEHYMVLYNGNAEVVGNFRALNFYKASDIRIKEDIRKLIDDYDCRDILMQIDGVAYRFKQGVSSSVNKRFVGFIAQQVESVVPEAVQLIDGILHVDYEALLPYLNEAIKKNYRDIYNVKAENQQLRKSIDILYSEFVKREAIVKYQHHPSSMFSDNAMPTKNNTSAKSNRRRTTAWRWLLFILASVALFISGAVAVYFITAQNQSPDQPTVSHVGPPSFDKNSDRVVLTEFFISTGGFNWTTNYGWLTALDMCTWIGVECDTDARVSKIRLKEYGLTGTIPSSIGNLDRLTVLSLPDNDIEGTLPDSLFTLPKLATLSLAHNPRLSGTIPSVEPPSLFTLSVQGCNMTGNLPTWLTGSKVTNIMVQHNRFIGQIPTLTLQLYGLGFGSGRFESNLFEGSVPRIVGSIPDINLANNRLNGTLEIWGQRLSANQLILANNSISGHFPFTNSQLSGMTTLDISNNLFTSVRSDLVLPTQLKLCNASNNPFKCPIPNWLVTKCGATCK